MNVVDTSGWLEYFADGPNADDFSVPLKDVKNLIVPTISIYENNGDQEKVYWLKAILVELI